jgi:hypothetical protein
MTFAEDWDTMNKKFLTDLGFGPKADEGDEPPEEPNKPGTKPKVCPKCKSAWWDRERKVKK